MHSFKYLRDVLNLFNDIYITSFPLWLYLKTIDNILVSQEPNKIALFVFIVDILIWGNRNYEAVIITRELIVDVAFQKHKSVSSSFSGEVEFCYYCVASNTVVKS